jgi:hypothetical protein
LSRPFGGISLAHSVVYRKCTSRGALIVFHSPYRGAKTESWKRSNTYPMNTRYFHKDLHQKSYKPFHNYGNCSRSGWKPFNYVRQTSLSPRGWKHLSTFHWVGEETF